MDADRGVHPDCINASNPYHECVEYCFRKIAEAKARFAETNKGVISFRCLSICIFPQINVLGYSFPLIYGSWIEYIAKFYIEGSYGERMRVKENIVAKRIPHM